MIRGFVLAMVLPISVGAQATASPVDADAVLAALTRADLGDEAFLGQFQPFSDGVVVQQWQDAAFLPEEVVDPYYWAVSADLTRGGTPVMMVNCARYGHPVDAMIQAGTDAFAVSLPPVMPTDPMPTNAVARLVCVVDFTPFVPDALPDKAAMVAAIQSRMPEAADMTPGTISAGLAGVEQPYVPAPGEVHWGARVPGRVEVGAPWSVVYRADVAQNLIIMTDLPFVTN